MAASDSIKDIGSEIIIGFLKTKMRTVLDVVGTRISSVGMWEGMYDVRPSRQIAVPNMKKDEVNGDQRIIK